MEEGQEYSEYTDNSILKIRDLEEKQRILKDRIILLGKNIITIKEKHQEEITEIKKNMEIMKNTIERLRDFLETLSSEIPNFAKKQEIEILKKQAIMFQPMERLK